MTQGQMLGKDHSASVAAGAHSLYNLLTFFTFAINWLEINPDVVDMQTNGADKMCSWFKVLND